MRKTAIFTVIFGVVFGVTAWVSAPTFTHLSTDATSPSSVAPVEGLGMLGTVLNVWAGLPAGT